MLKTPIPFIMIGIYILFVIFLSCRASIKKRKPNETFEDYYTGGKSMAGNIIALIIMITFYSGTTFTGQVSFAYGYGMVFLQLVADSVTIGTIMYFFVEKVWPLSKKYRLSTLSDLLELRYQSKALKLLSSSVIVCFNIIWLILEIRTLGYIFNIASGGAVSNNVGAFLAFAIIIAYVATGGVKSVAAVDSFSSVVMLVGSLTAVIYIISYFYDGSLANIFQAVAETHPDFMLFQAGDADFGLAYWSIYALTGVVMFIYPSNYMEICLAKSLKEIKKSSIIAALSGPWFIIIFIMGYAALGLDSLGFTIVNPESSLLEMASLTGSGLLLGVVTTFIFAASLGTLDSTLIGLSGLVSNDIIANVRRIRSGEPNIGETGDDAAVIRERVTRSAKTEVMITRIVSVLLGFIAFGFSLVDLPVMVFLKTYCSQGLLQLVPCVIGGLYWKKATPQAAIGSIVIGVGAYITIKECGLSASSVLAGAPGALISVAAFIIISLCTYKKYYAEHGELQGIYDDFFVKGKVETYIEENF